MSSRTADHLRSVSIFLHGAPSHKTANSAGTASTSVHGYDTIKQVKVHMRGHLYPSTCVVYPDELCILYPWSSRKTSAMFTLKAVVILTKVRTFITAKPRSILDKCPLDMPQAASTVFSEMRRSSRKSRSRAPMRAAWGSGIFRVGTVEKVVENGGSSQAGVDFCLATAASLGGAPWTSVHARMTRA